MRYNANIVNLTNKFIYPVYNGKKTSFRGHQTVT